MKKSLMISLMAGVIFCMSGISSAEDKTLSTVSTGLVLYLPFENATPQDWTGNSNNITNNGATLTDGKIGSAYSFNGTSASVSLALPPDQSTNINTGSVFAWIKTTNAGSSYCGIVVKQNAYGMFLKDNVFIIYDWTSGERSTGVNLADGNWHFVGFTFQNADTAPSNNAILYIDGAAVLTTTLQIANQTAAIAVSGGNNPVTVQYFNGTIDEVMVWNRVLTGNEITTLYQAKTHVLSSPKK